jgi:ferrous iron transport protein B
MSARTIQNHKERLITILVTPLISCSARIPVYTLIISLVIPSKYVYGINLQGLVLMFFYILGFLAALGSAWLMNLLIKAKEKSYFIMEMPIYRLPRMRNVIFTMFEKVKIFLFDAGKIIIAISIVLWVLSSYGPGKKFEEIDKKYALELSIQTRENEDSEIKRKIRSEKLESSYAGILGKSIEPAIRPMGFDWRIGIALVTSFAAREVFVGTMSTIYSIGEEEGSISGIREKMLNEKDPKTGKPFFSFALGISLMLFYAFAMQCMSTVAVVYRETGGWKWPIIQILYMSGLAYAVSTIAFQLLKE